MQPDMLLLITDLALGALGTFLGILLWSLTRDSAWMLVIIAVVVRFGESVFQTMSVFGIFTFGQTLLFGIPVFWFLLKTVSWLLLVIAFAIMVRRNRV